MTQITAFFSGRSAVELIVIGVIALIVIGLLIRWMKSLITIAYLGVMLAGVYFIASVFIPEVPKQSSVVTLVGLAVVIVVLGFLYIPSLSLQALRLVVLIAAFPALFYHVAVKYVFNNGGGTGTVTNNSLSVAGNLSLGVSIGVIVLGLIVAVIVYFYSRRIFIRRNENIEKKDIREDTRRQISEHYRDERDYRTTIDRR